MGNEASKVACCQEIPTAQIIKLGDETINTFDVVNKVHGLSAIPNAQGLVGEIVGAVGGILINKTEEGVVAFLDDAVNKNMEYKVIPFIGAMWIVIGRGTRGLKNDVIINAYLNATCDHVSVIYTPRYRHKDVWNQSIAQKNEWAVTVAQRGRSKNKAIYFTIEPEEVSLARKPIYTTDKDKTNIIKTGKIKHPDSGQQVVTRYIINDYYINDYREM